MLLHIRRKMRSQRGASLSMALMLFLVCTVVASITLSAATAVSGRLSQLEEAEASYYNVSSAARFVWDELSKDPGGLEVKVTRTCDAQKDESGNWTGWTMKIDSVLDSSDAGKHAIEGSKATLFQIATYDLIMDRGSVGGAVKLSFTTGRSPKEEEIASRFDPSGSVPTPKEVVFSNASYDEFTFAVDDLPQVGVSVTRHDDQTFDFMFKEADGDSYVCTLTALVETNGGTLDASPTADGKFSGGVTTVTWKPIDMTVGELS